MPRWVETAPRIMRQAFVETSARVRWSECDLQRHAYYGNYMTWCDLGREAFALAAGVDYRDYLVTTTEFHIRFHTPAHYLDDLLIRTWTAPLTIRLDCHYEIYRKTGGQLIAEAKSQHALVDPQKGLRLTGPASWHEKFEAFLENRKASL